MRRDMNLIRELLLKFEDLDTRPQLLAFPYGEPQVEGYTDDQVYMHIRMLVEAGLVSVGDGGGFAMDGRFLFQGLHWNGHEFIPSIRDQEVWAKTKAALKAGGSETISAVWEIAKAVGKAEIKRRTGYEL